MNQWTMICMAFVFGTSTIASGSIQKRSEKFFELYNSDIEAAASAVPQKRIRFKNKELKLNPKLGLGAFSQKSIKDKSYVDAKNWHRNKILVTAKSQYSMEVFVESPWLPNDQPFPFIDLPIDQIEYNLLRIEKNTYQSAKLPQLPWADDYWAFDAGALGARYNDDVFWFKDNWHERLQHISAVNAPKLYSEGNLLKLSPAEKYDLLVGDQTPYKIKVGENSYPVFGSLTYRMWAEGAQYYNSTGEVEGWMGICHGWAPASYSLPHPKRSVDVADLTSGKDIHFYPSDIKALASLLWANAKIPHKFIGGRCNDKTPQRDQNGRLTDPNCLDTNPATWHIVLVNQIAKAKRSFIMDANFDYQVWNQPVYSYAYNYFRPSDKKTFNSLSVGSADSPLTELSKWAEDPYKNYRHPKAKYVVGINLALGYAMENSPTTFDIDFLSEENITKVDYYYDLELDEQLNIIGGEWYQNLHPDFLWTPPLNFRAQSVGDHYLQGVWSEAGVNAFIKTNPEAKNIVVQSSLRGQPLAQIVEGLIMKSRKEP